LAKLPDYLFSTLGGNTACVEAISEEDCRIVFDAGTGIRNLGEEIMAQKKQAVIHLFFSHFHWDHIQGFPFFGPAFNKMNTINLYSPNKDLKNILSGQMQEPYFPISLDSMSAQKNFVELLGTGIQIGNVTIKHRAMSHPGGSYSYAIEEKGKKAIYSTDTELVSKDFDRSPENEAYFKNADLLIIDAQYTLGEAIEKQYWGHSSFSLAADFAASWHIKRLVLFHHEPAYNDQKIGSILKSAEWYLKHIESKDIEVVLAREGSIIEV